MVDGGDSRFCIWNSCGCNLEEISIELLLDAIKVHQECSCTFVKASEPLLAFLLSSAMGCLDSLLRRLHWRPWWRCLLFSFSLEARVPRLHDWCPCRRRSLRWRHAAWFCLSRWRWWRRLDGWRRRLAWRHRARRRLRSLQVLLESFQPLFLLEGFQRALRRRNCLCRHMHRAADLEREYFDLKLRCSSAVPFPPTTRRHCAIACCWLKAPGPDKVSTHFISDPPAMPFLVCPEVYEPVHAIIVQAVRRMEAAIHWTAVIFALAAVESSYAGGCLGRIVANASHDQRWI
mmetsp:Transcript_91266/g.162539  ORF Transcript_91266/g.162539 Transcript_91266/m.162539 type:complete len:289 (+) Transcript_91266:187-1053(+)